MVAASGLAGPETTAIVLSSPFAKRSLGFRWGVVATGMIISAAFLVAVNGLFPFLNTILAPASVLSFGALLLIVEAFVFGAVNFNRVTLGPQGVAQRWGPFQRMIPAPDIDRIFTFDGRQRHYHGVWTRSDRNLTFGAGYMAEDFEMARRWLRAFADSRGIRYVQVSTPAELRAFFFQTRHK